MKITHLSGISRSAGGLFYAVRSLCKSQLELGGISLQVFGAETASSGDDLPSWSPVPVKTYKSFGPLQTSFKLRKWLDNSDADLVHRHGIWTDPQWAALQWQRKTNKPVVLSPHGMLDPWAVGNSAWKKKLAGALFANESLRKASCIHALCHSEVESIRAYGLKNPVACIPNGIELPNLDEPNPAAVNERKRLLFLGRIHPKKGVEELLKAWSQLDRNVAESWELLIAGWDDGGHEPGLKALAEQLNITDSVSFPGSKYGAEKDALLRSVDAFILPSFSEGLPMSVLEAWAYRLPVVMTDFCNLPEGFDAGAALWVKPEVGSIAEGIRSLTTLPDANRRDIGTSGRNLVEEKFTWGRIASEMKAVYEWCLGGGDAPACVIED
jgi:poly(glycerol-phosphate) alpha-glucosyltransferase